MTRKTKQDWLQAGMMALGQGGIDALTIERLTSLLGVTKGSFYHHFKNQQTYREALLAAWETDSIHIVQAIPPKASPSEAIATILGSLRARDPQAEVAIRAWAMQDPLARVYVARVDRYRVEAMQKILGDAAGDQAAGDLRGLMLYSMLLGCLSMVPPLSIDEVEPMVNEFKRVFKRKQS